MSTAIVTGGSAGIGLAIARELLGQKYQVISLDLKPNPEKRVKHMAVDLTDPKATEWAAKEIAKAASEAAEEAQRDIRAHLHGESHGQR